MKTILKLEYIALFVLAVYGFNQTDFAWWWFLILFLTPDLSMVGYLVNTKVGAFSYNLVHHFGTAILIYLLGKYLNLQYLEMMASVMLAHSVFDRMLGYGLKYEDGFQNTHLGKIGNSK